MEVVLRYGFGGGVGFYDELAGFLLVWLTFLGAVLARREGAHIGIRDLIRRLPGPARRAAVLLEHLVMLGLHLLLFWFGAVLVIRFLDERAITMPVPMGRLLPGAAPLRRADGSSGRPAPLPAAPPGHCSGRRGAPGDFALRIVRPSPVKPGNVPLREALR